MIPERVTLATLLLRAELPDEPAHGLSPDQAIVRQVERLVSDHARLVREAANAREDEASIAATLARTTEQHTRDLASARSDLADALRRCAHLQGRLRSVARLALAEDGS